MSYDLDSDGKGFLSSLETMMFLRIHEFHERTPSFSGTLADRSLKRKSFNAREVLGCFLRSTMLICAAIMYMTSTTR